MLENLEHLNPMQQEAVCHREGPLMIIAGAGSGKTSVLTTRIAYLIQQGVHPKNILALTFTNKAAHEMKVRIQKIIGAQQNVHHLYIGTFHSIFARILRKEAHLLGYPSQFTIYDAEDAKTLLKSIIRDSMLDPKVYKENVVYSRISKAKNALLSPALYAIDKDMQQADIRMPAMSKIYDAYTKQCFNNKAMDFDDLLMKMYELLHQVPSSLQYYQQTFQYILIDEFQDTNVVQYKIANMLAATHRNICVVGDDAQSIYSFRGATIDNILQFEKDYPIVKIVKLEQNYRSTRFILQAANAVILKNEKQIQKELWTNNIQGEKIHLVKHYSGLDEARFVVDKIKELKYRNHYQNNQFAILYRTNAQSRILEDALRQQSIPYRIYGGISFYQRKEIKDCIAYLRFIVNPNDDESLKRIINYPSRGIGDKTMDKLVAVAQQHQVPMYHILKDATAHGFKSATLEVIQGFVAMIESFLVLLPTTSAYTIAYEVAKQSLLLKELYMDKTVEGLTRYENVQELLRGIEEFAMSTVDEYGVELDVSLNAYLQQVSLFTDIDPTKKATDEDVVQLMTIHSAKGLEFSIVFMVGMDEGIFPNANVRYNLQELEEERRLFYVAITRAKEYLFVSHAQTRHQYGNMTYQEPSRFISEIPSSFIEEKITHQKYSTVYKNPYTQSTSSYILNNSLNKKAQDVSSSHIPSANFKASNHLDIQEGHRVEHMKFGFGKVTNIEKKGSPNSIATIHFEKTGEKRMMLAFAQLRIELSHT